jgi:hypothetical protein
MYPQKTTFKRKSLFSKAGLMCALIGVSCKKVYLDTVRQLKYWSRHPNSLFWFLHSAFPISLSPCLPIFSFPPLFNTCLPFSLSFYPSPIPQIHTRVLSRTCLKCCRKRVAKVNASFFSNDKEDCAFPLRLRAIFPRPSF